MDVVDIFRKPEFVEEIVKDAKAKARVIWMQEGIVNEDAKKLAMDMGMEVVKETNITEEEAEASLDKLMSGKFDLKDMYDVWEKFAKPGLLKKLFVDNTYNIILRCHACRWLFI